MNIDKEQKRTDKIESWLLENYNNAMSVYNRGSMVRLTNGSSSYFVDCYPNDSDEIVVRGHRYGETIDERCSFEKDNLLNLLSRTL